MPFQLRIDIENLPTNKVRGAKSTWVDNAKYLFVVLATLGTYLALVAFRSLDDNTLVSWRWVFANVSFGRVLLALIFGIAISFALSQVSIPKVYCPIFLFVISFVAASFFWKEPEVVIDASRYFTQAKHFAIYGPGYFLKEWGRNISVWTDLPLVPLLYGVVFKIFGESRLYVEVFTTLLFSGSTVLTYLLGKELWGEDTGFLAGLLMLGIPYVFTQVPLMLVDVPTMFFFMLSILVFIKAINIGGARIIIFSSLTVLLALLCKYSTWLMLSVLPVAFLVYFFGKQKQAWSAIGIRQYSARFNRYMMLYRGMAVVVITATLVAVFILFKFDVVSHQIGLLADYQRAGLKRWGESFYSTFFFQVNPFITLAAIYSIYVAFKKRDPKYLIVSWLVFLVIALRIERIRYIIMIFPMVTLMAAYGLSEINSEGLRRFTAWSAVASSLAVAIFAYLPFVQSISAVNLKDAGAYLNSIGARDIEVFSLPQKGSIDINPAVSVPLLDIFAEGNIYYRYDQVPPRVKKIEKSPLRFTWDYRNPGYYSLDNNKAMGEKMVVVISSSKEQALPDSGFQIPDGYRLAKLFKASSGVFRYQTVVTVYRSADK